MYQWRKPKPRRAAEPTHSWWDEWRIVLTSKKGFGEECDPKARLFIIESEPTPERAHAHAAAHIYLKHHMTAGDFTEEDCTDADDQVKLWLDELDISVFDELPSRDGEPTMRGIAG